MKNYLQSKRERNDSVLSGTILRAKVLNVNIINGRIECDVIDENGNYYTACEVISQGSGGANGYSTPSIEKNQQVVIILTGRNSSPFVLGTTYRSSLSNIQLNSETVNSSQDYHTLTINDDYRKVGLNSVQITEKNGINLSSGQDIRLQLMLGGKLRISAAGQTVDNPLNGQQYIDITTPYFQSLSKISQAHTAVLQSISSAMTAINTATATMSTAINAIGNTPLTGSSLGLITASYTTSINTAMTSIATAATNLTTTIAPYLTPEYLDPITSLKNETEDTLNTKIDLPK